MFQYAIKILKYKKMIFVFGIEVQRVVKMIDEQSEIYNCIQIQGLVITCRYMYIYICLHFYSFIMFFLLSLLHSTVTHVYHYVLLVLS